MTESGEIRLELPDTATLSPGYQRYRYGQGLHLLPAAQILLRSVLGLGEESEVHPNARRSAQHNDKDEVVRESKPQVLRSAGYSTGHGGGGGGGGHLVRSDVDLAVPVVMRLLGVSTDLTGSHFTDAGGELAGPGLDCT